MAKNSVEAYGALGKTNLLTFDPSTLTIVTDKAHALYDERAEMPLDENMVLNIMHHGVFEPIIVRKDPENGETQVVAGRQRVRCAIEANKRLKAQGLEAIAVPGVVRRDNEHELMAVMIGENEIRQNDSPLTRAAKMQRLLSRGSSEAEIGIVFGCSTQTVKNTLALLECSGPVRSAVESGKIPVTHALKLKALAPAEQRSKVEELVAAGEGAKPRQRAAAQRKALGDNTPRVRSRKELEAQRDAYKKSHDHMAVRLLSWVLGERDEP